MQGVDTGLRGGGQPVVDLYRDIQFQPPPAG